MHLQKKLICELINNRQVTEFIYKNKPRLVEPYLLGMSQGGDLTLSAWQLEGGSGEGFRDFKVKEMSRISSIDETFECPHNGYNPDDVTMTEIYCRYRRGM